MEGSQLTKGNSQAGDRAGWRISCSPPEKSSNAIQLGMSELRYFQSHLSAQILIAENFRRECLDEGALFPGIQGKAGLATGLFQKSDAIPMVFDRNLGQKQATMAAQADHQAMPADLHLLRANRLQG